MEPLHLVQTLAAKVTPQVFREKLELHQERLVHPLEARL